MFKAYFDNLQIVLLAKIHCSVFVRLYFNTADWIFALLTNLYPGTQISLIQLWSGNGLTQNRSRY